MTYAKAIVFFLMLSGCSSVTFTVADTLSDKSETDSSDAGPDTLLGKPQVKNDGASDGGLDASPIVCEPYSCKPGCGPCTDGLQCGSGGASTCGSSNCGLDIRVDAATFSCPSDMNMVFKCAHYYGQNTKDVLPRCLFIEGTTADGDFTRWCCPQ